MAPRALGAGRVLLTPMRSRAPVLAAHRALSPQGKVAPLLPKTPAGAPEKDAIHTLRNRMVKVSKVCDDEPKEASHINGPL